MSSFSKLARASPFNWLPLVAVIAVAVLALGTLLFQRDTVQAAGIDFTASQVQAVDAMVVPDSDPSADVTAHVAIVPTLGAEKDISTATGGYIGDSTGFWYVIALTLGIVALAITALQMRFLIRRDRDGPNTMTSLNGLDEPYIRSARSMMIEQGRVAANPR